MNFSQIIGREEIIEYFLKAYAAGRLSHAYIVEGERGIGKRTLVDAFANFLVCENPNGREVCRSCRSCIQFDTGNHPDIIYLQPSKKTGYGVDDIRDGILSEVDIRPYQSRFKLYIIEEAETMSVAAQNVLLKTIEEPPVYAIFFLLAANKSKLLETVLSRCIQLKMPVLSGEEMTEYLSMTGKTEAKDLIPFAEGNIGRLLQLYESESFAAMKRDLENLLDRFIKSEERGIIEWTKILASYKDNLEEALTVLQIIVRERLRSIYLQKRFSAMNLPAGKTEKKYYMLSLNMIRAKKQMLSNVNKDMILWNLFLP